MANIEVKGLTKVYGEGKLAVTALKDVSFSLELGEFCVVLGPSGSGKSTLLNVLGGMDRATSGDIFVSNENICAYSEKQMITYRRESIGFVFQFYNLMRNLTALENVALSSVSGGMTAKDALINVGLEKRANKFPAQLSGGEQQRDALARAIVKYPNLLLCDEPTGALDSKTGKNILKLLLSLVKMRDKTIIVVTHNATLAQIADRVIRLSDGEIVGDEKRTPKSIEEIDW